ASWRGAQAWGGIICPESADERLLFRALRGRNDRIAAYAFHFIVCGSVVSARHVGRRRRAELTRRGDNKRNALTPIRAQSQRNQTDRILSPMARQIDREIIYPQMWLGDLPTIIENARHYYSTP